MSKSHSALQWWLDGLTAPLPAPVRSWLMPPRPLLLLHISDDRLEVGDAATAVTRYAAATGDGSEVADLADKLRRDRERGACVALCLPKNAGVTRDVTVSGGDVKQHLAERIEHYTPFARDQVYYGYRLLSGMSAGGPTSVRLLAAPRRTVDEQLVRLKHWAVDVDTVLLEGEEHLDGCLLPFSGGTRLRPAHLLLPAIGVVIAVLAAYLPWADKTEAVIQLERRAAAVRAEANQGISSEDAEPVERLLAIARERAERVSAVAVLDEMSRVIPDHTWLRHVIIEPDTATLQGDTRNTTDLVSRLETSPLFDEPKFEAALTQDTRSDYQRFKLTLRVLRP